MAEGIRLQGHVGMLSGRRPFRLPARRASAKHAPSAMPHAAKGSPRSTASKTATSSGGGGSQAGQEGATTSWGRTLIVTPTYNEKDNLPHFLDEVRKAVPDAHILVVDDNSPDG